MQQIKTILLAGLAALLLSACGGGSSSSDSTQPVIVKFLDLTNPSEYGVQTTLTYDETGNRLTKSSEFIDFISMYLGEISVINVPLREYAYSYDFINNEANETCINCQNSYEGNTTIYTFNDDGVILKSRSKISSKEYFYDTDGDIETVSYTYEYIDYNQTVVSNFNKSGQLIKDLQSFVSTVDSNATLLGSFSLLLDSYVRTYIYHENGRVATLIEIITHTDDNTWEMWTSNFGEDGNLIDTIYDSGTILETQLAGKTLYANEYLVFDTTVWTKAGKDTFSRTRAGAEYLTLVLNDDLSKLTVEYFYLDSNVTTKINIETVEGENILYLGTATIIGQDINTTVEQNIQLDVLSVSTDSIRIKLSYEDNSTKEGWVYFNLDDLK